MRVHPNIYQLCEKVIKYDTAWNITITKGKIILLKVLFQNIEKYMSEKKIKKILYKYGLQQWDNLWESRGGSMVNGAPREFPESTQCTP